MFKPEIYLPKEGVGNCIKCKPNDDNRFCREYQPIVISTYVVENKNDTETNY